ncbi:MAG: hypothetical protein IKX39_05300 [Muribaculaceae bacterium]|nr:hypothetical protein [Muribaculaceae bacterium]
MKKLIISCLACLAMLAAMAQNDSTALTPTQWQHALAVIAQYEVLNAGYGQKSEIFESQAPQGYTLDDLDATYRSQAKWQNVYNRLKALENDGGTMARIKELAGSLAPHVERDMSVFLKKQPAVEPEVAAVDTAAPVPDTLAVADVPQEPVDEQKGGFNAHLLFDLLLTLLALGGLALAWFTRSELNKLRRATRSELETTNENMQQLANDVSQHVKALLQRVGNIEANQRVMKPRQVTRQDEQRVEAVAKREDQPAERTYYLSKPDDNDCFNRVSDEFELGNSLFVLTTTDGVHGTYQVIDNRDVHRFALMMPSENLTRACSGNAIQMSAGMTRIITDRPGEALFDNGQWRVIVKAIIHYEA